MCASSAACAVSPLSGAPLKIAIFGCGYLGSRLARIAVGAGHEVFALTRNAEQVAQLRSMGVKKVVQNLLQTDAWHAEFEVMHYDLAVCCVSSGGMGMEGYRQSYLEGMQSIFQWAGNGQRVGHFLYTGTTSVYPQVKGERVSEGDVPGQLTEVGAVLLEAEELVRDNAALFKQATVLRLGGLYGPGRHYLLRQLREGQTQFAGRGDFIINHIHVDDAIAAIGTVQERGKPGFHLYNVVDGCYPTKEEVVRFLAQELGMDTAAIVFDEDDITARAARRQVPGWPAGLVPNRCIDNALIRNELDWMPQYRSYREGYRALMAE